jgi:hypothetical protein
VAAWHARGETLSVSVNVSGRQLDDDRIVEHIRHALDTTGLHPTSLVIEVTETALMRDTDAAVRRLRAIKDIGVSVAIDDFGTGYCSLAYLQQFPVDCIKIDKSFTSAMVGSPDSAVTSDLRLSPRASKPRARWTCSGPIMSTRPKATYSPDRSNQRYSRLSSSHRGALQARSRPSQRKRNSP